MRIWADTKQVEQVVITTIGPVFGHFEWREISGAWKDEGDLEMLETYLIAEGITGDELDGVMAELEQSGEAILYL